MGLYERLNANPQTVSTNFIEECVEKIPPQAYSVDIDLSGTSRFYRARYNTGFGDTDINEFSYNHNLENIRTLCLNSGGVPVLYTSTYPQVALNEIRDDNQRHDRFYLSIWQFDGEDVKCAINITNNDLEGNAKKYQDIIKDKQWNPIVYQYLSSIGDLLEMPGTDYRASSRIASKLFEGNEAIVTVSQKSNGKELNFTFRRDVADNKIKLKYVFDCDVPENDTLLFKVHRIGISNGDNIVWHQWSVDINSVEFDPQRPHPNIPIETLREELKNNTLLLNMLQLNVNKKHDEMHNGAFDFQGSLCRVLFRINLFNR